MRKVVQQIPRSEDAESTKRLPTHWTDTFQVGDRRLQRDGRLASATLAGCHVYSSISRENRRASNASRSATWSPTLRNFTGTSSASWTATTIPPFAVPSSLVTTRPVTLTACAKVFACATAFCP